MITLTLHERTFEFDIPPSDHIARIIESTGKWYEQAMLDDIYQRQPKGTALDIGACFGTHSAWFSAVCGMRVIAFEPNSDTYQCLISTVDRNNLDVKPIWAAAGNRAGAVDIRAPRVPHNVGSTPVRLKPRGADGIPMMTIDSMGLEDVGLIKIDVEGFEVRVLQGAIETIKRCQPLIYVEAGRNSLLGVDRILMGLAYYRFGVFNKTKTYGYSPIETLMRASEPRTLSVAIMAHHKRDHLIPYLHERLGPVRVIWDQKNDRWDTGRRAMLAFDPNATHHIVVQDDAVLPLDFIQGVERAIQFIPTNPISFYTGKTRPNHIFVEHMVKKAQREGTSWIAMNGPWWGPAVAIPTKMIPEMIAYCDKNLVHIANYDRRMSRYFLRQNIECYYSVPSLVSHRVGPENPSLVWGRGSGPARTAFSFIGEDKSALDVGWTYTAVRPAHDSPKAVMP